MYVKSTMRLSRLPREARRTRKPKQPNWVRNPKKSYWIQCTYLKCGHCWQYSGGKIGQNVQYAILVVRCLLQENIILSTRPLLKGNLLLLKMILKIHSQWASYSLCHVFRL